MALSKIKTGSIENTIDLTANDGTFNGDVFVSGTVSATSFIGDGSALTGVSAGKVLQVLSATKTNTFSTTTGGASPVDITGLSVAITPSSASNKIYVMFSVHVGSSALSTVGIRLMRGGTAISIGDAASARPRMSSASFGHGGYNWHSNVISTSYLDSPSTTGATTYKLQMVGNGTATCYVNRTGRDQDTSNDDYRSTSHITVMEIEG